MMRVPCCLLLVLPAVTSPSAAAQEQPPGGAARVALSAPEDGGTPRDPARVEAMGANEYRVRASVEEGRSPLTHAVSRVDLICRNGGTGDTSVTLHLDLSGDGRRTNLDTSGFG